MRSALAILILATASSLAIAHGPSRQKVTEQVTIKAPPAAVWAKLKDFNGLQSWHPAVEKSAATDGSKAGSVRTLTIKGGGKAVEELESINDEQMTLKYRYKEGTLPVSNYQSTLSVKPADGGSEVEWRGAFYRGFPNNDPPPELNDEAAVKAITGIYKSGLENLKKTLEK